MKSGVIIMALFDQILPKNKQKKNSSVLPDLHKHLKKIHFNGV